MSAHEGLKEGPKLGASSLENVPSQGESKHLQVKALWLATGTYGKGDLAKRNQCQLRGTEIK